MVFLDWNILILGRKASGKSYLARELINDYLEKFPSIKNIIWVSPTASVDKVQSSYLSKLEKKKLNITHWVDIFRFDFNGKTTVKTNQLHDLLRELTMQYNPSDEEDTEPKTNLQAIAKQNALIQQARAGGLRMRPIYVSKDVEDELKKSEPKVSTKEEPHRIIYLDDVSNELSDASLLALIKMSRHYRTVVIMLSQSIIGLPRNAWMNLDSVYLAGGTLTSDYLKMLNDRYLAAPDQPEYLEQHYSDLPKYTFMKLSLSKNKISRIKAE